MLGSPSSEIARTDGRRQIWRRPPGMAYNLAMPFLDPDNPERPLTLLEIQAILDRGRAEAEAGHGTDLNLLLAKWKAEDAADQRAQRSGKPSAA